MSYEYRFGMGDLAQPGSFVCSLPNWALTDAQATACVGVNLAQPGSFVCSLPNWALTDAQATACVVGVTPVAPPPAPTQAQINAVAASTDPGAAAAALVQQLSNQAVTQTQANTQAAVAATPENPYYTLGIDFEPAVPPGGSCGFTDYLSGACSINWWLIGGIGFGALFLLAWGTRR